MSIFRVASRLVSPSAPATVGGRTQTRAYGFAKQKRSDEIMRNLLVAVALGAILANLGSAGAQVYPSRPLTMVVPFAAGGPNDGIARALAERMQASLGQPVMIENVDGAAGSIGTGRLARAAPDGYTLGIGYWGTHVAHGVLYVLAFGAVR